MPRYMNTAESVEWTTPRWLVSQLAAEFGPFDLDPCASAENAVCPTFFTVDQDGLTQEWGSRRVFMNPPYGSALSRWMEKAFQEAQCGATVVCLVPARTDAGWWHDFALRGEVRFIRGRLQYGGSKVNAPFPTAIVIFRPRELAGVQPALMTEGREGRDR